MARTKPEATELDIERGLLALAHSSGNAKAALRFLKADKRNKFIFGERALYAWRQRYPDRYEELRREVTPQVREQAAEEHMEMAAALTEANRKMVKRTIKEVDQIPARDLPTANRNLSVAAATEIDKAEMLRDRPTIRVQHELTGILAELKSQGVEFIDGEAVEEELPALGE